MTCEVAVMNKNGLALAADSAVTLGPQMKVYHSAEKLFRLSETEPVAVMTHGSTQILGVPLETVIKTYRRRIGARRFDYIDQYAEDFLRHLESSNPLFPEDAQRAMVREHAASYWKSQVLTPVWEKFGEDTAAWPVDAWTMVTEKVEEDGAIWERYDDLPIIGAGLGPKVLPLYEADIAEVETAMFDGVKIPEKIRSGLRRAVQMMYQRDFFCQRCRSGVVIAGFGDQEAFPKVVSFTIDTIVAGRLRYRKDDEGQVTRSNDAFVMPFAQRHMVDMFYSGISPSVQDQMTETLRAVIREHLAPTTPPAMPDERIEAIVTAFNDRLKDESRESYTQPLIAAVAALPLSELCGLAEALVSLTAFRARMSAAEVETVGGDIDVAAISKGDGFVWVQRKELVGHSRHTGRTRFHADG